MNAPPVMTCDRFLNGIRVAAAYHEDLGRCQAIMPWWRDGLPQVSVLFDRLAPATEQRLRAEFPKDAGSLMGFWMRGEIAIKGPKVFRPTLEQCLAMEQIAPRIAIGDYAQPYSVMLIDLPEEYRRRRARQIVSSLYVGTHAPEFLMIGFPPCTPPVVWTHLLFNSNTARTIPTLLSDAALEDGIIREYGEDSYFAVNSPSPEERQVLAGLMRLAINSMLLLMEYGCKRLGPVNEPHYQRLQHHLQVARKRGNRVAEAEREVRLAPQLYGFEQDIVLHENALSDTDTRGEGSAEAQRRPHWRRGHWKMHAHGPGRTLRKRILIKPVMVNRHLLVNEGDSLTTYRAR